MRFDVDPPDVLVQRTSSGGTPLSEYPIVIHHVLDESTHAGSPQDWRRAVASTRSGQCELIDATVEWARERGRPLDPDRIAVLLAAAMESGDDLGPTEWTKTRVSHMFCCHINNWAWDHLAEWSTEDDDDRPDREALWLLVSFLIDTARLGPASHPPTVLRQQFGYIGLDADGRYSEDERFWGIDPAGDLYDGPTCGEA